MMNSLLGVCGSGGRRSEVFLPLLPTLLPATLRLLALDADVAAVETLLMLLLLELKSVDAVEADMNDSRLGDTSRRRSPGW